MVKTWWQERAPRERWVLMIGGAALGLTALFLIIEPVVRERQRLAAEIPQLREDLAWMKARVGTIERLRSQEGGGPAPNPGTLTPAQVQGAVGQAGLREELAELETAGEGVVRLSFEGVAFPDLTQLLQTLRRTTGARVTQARIQALADKPGMVEAQLTLQAEAAS